MKSVNKPDGSLTKQRTNTDSSDRFFKRLSKKMCEHEVLMKRMINERRK